MRNYNWDCVYEENFDEDIYESYELENDIRKRYRCGGWANKNGPCGALDCEDCFPGNLGAEDEE